MAVYNGRHTHSPICGLFVVPVRHDSQRPKLLLLGRNFLNGKLLGFSTDRRWWKGMRVRLRAIISIHRTPVA